MKKIEARLVLGLDGLLKEIVWEIEMEPEPRSLNPIPSGTASDEDIYDDGHLRIEHNCYYASIAESVLLLTRTEFLILSSLARHVDRIVPSELLWKRVWGPEEPFTPLTLRVHVCNLRRKILPFGLNVKSMVAVGYSLMRPCRKKSVA